MNSTGAKYKILIVDDEPAGQVVLTATLKAEYEIHTASDGESALKLAAELRPDVIILDVVMPGLDGYEVIKRLKAGETTKNIPVIFISGLDSTQDEEKGLALGAADFIYKPLWTSVVRHRVRNQMKIVNLMRRLSKYEPI